MVSFRWRGEGRAIPPWRHKQIRRQDGRSSSAGQGEIVVGFAGRELAGVAAHAGVPLRSGLELIQQGFVAALFLWFGERLVGAGELDEDTRAGHVAGDGLVDEGLRDEIGVPAHKGIDGAAQALGGAAGRGLVVFGCGRRFAAGFPWILSPLRFRLFEVRDSFGHVFLPRAATIPAHVMRGNAARAVRLRVDV